MVSAQRKELIKCSNDSGYAPRSRGPGEEISEKENPLKHRVSPDVQRARTPVIYVTPRQLA